MQLGRTLGYSRDANSIHVQTEHAELTLRFITDRIVNVFIPVHREQASRAIEDIAIQPLELTVEDDAKLVISSTSLTIEVLNPFGLVFKNSAGEVINEDYLDRGICINKEAEHKSIEIYKKLKPGDHFYGFGEKAGFLDKSGEELIMWCSDIPEPHVPSMQALYKSIPFFVGFNQGTAYGIFFDNTFKTYFDMGKSSEEYYSFAADGGNVDYYFIYGPAIKDVIKGYTQLTGRMNLPPIWALGYQQCRWSYFPENRVMEIATTMREKEIPCDVIYLDIDYMDGYRVFTWDQERFPNPVEMIGKLRKLGFKVITIVDPGIKKDKDYDVYQEALSKGYCVTEEDGVPYVGKVWPGDCIFPDFSNAEVRDWWGSLHQRLLDVGVAGIWNDMNEPAVFTDASQNREPDEVKTMPLSNLHKNDGQLTTHAEIHNVYGLLMAQATYAGLRRLSERRPFILTRAAYAGIQKYSALWTGDNHSFWDHLGMALPMCLNLGMSGVAFIGTDVGGFSHDCSAELLSRWVQVGCFTPFFRNHAAWGTRDQEPWAYDEQTEAINRKYIRLRYKLLPYIYNVFVEASRTGLPAMRPLVLEYPDDSEVYQIYDQFMFGENLLIAPVITPRTTYRHVYLPEGEWYNYFTGEKYAGNQHMLFHAPLDTLPLFVKAGSLIPCFEPLNYIGERRVKTLYFEIFPGTGEYEYYEDDGETMAYLDGRYNLTHFILKMEEQRLNLQITDKHRGYADGVENYTFQIMSESSLRFTINGAECPKPASMRVGSIGDI